MSAADLSAIKADLQKALDGGCTFSSLTPIQGRLDAVDAARYKTTPPDMTNIADVDECYGGSGRGVAAGAKNLAAKALIAAPFFDARSPPPPSRQPSPPHPASNGRRGHASRAARAGGWGDGARVTVGRG